MRGKHVWIRLRTTIHDSIETERVDVYGRNRILRTEYRIIKGSCLEARLNAEGMWINKSWDKEEPWFLLEPECYTLVDG